MFKSKRVFTYSHLKHKQKLFKEKSKKSFKLIFFFFLFALALNLGLYFMAFLGIQFDWIWIVKKTKLQGRNLNYGDYYNDSEENSSKKFQSEPRLSSSPSITKE